MGGKEGGTQRCESQEHAEIVRCRNDIILDSQSSESVRCIPSAVYANLQRKRKRISTHMITLKLNREKNGRKIRLERRYKTLSITGRISTHFPERTDDLRRRATLKGSSGPGKPIITQTQEWRSGWHFLLRRHTISALNP